MFPPEKLRKYPHMMPADIPVWERFLEAYGDAFIGFDYDVRVGEGIKPPPEVEDEFKKMWRELTKKRIDVVGYRDDYIAVIEVKPYARLSALGQAIAYRELYLRYFSPPQPVRALVVCERVDPDVMEVFEQYDVDVITV